MPEVILGLVIVALLTERYFTSRTHARELSRLTTAVLAKTPGEYVMMAQADEPTPHRDPEPSTIPDGFVGQAGLS